MTSRSILMNIILSAHEVVLGYVAAPKVRVSRTIKLALDLLETMINSSTT